MEIQDVFYIVGIIFMGALLILFIIVITLLFMLKRKITTLTKSFDKKFSLLSNIITNPQKTAAVIGGAVVEKAMHKASQLLTSRKKE